MMRTFVFTCGDINGIGPELVVKTLNRIKDQGKNFIVIIPGNVFESACALIKPEFDFEYQSGKRFNRKTNITILSLKKAKLNKGIPTRESGEVSYKAIQKSFILLKNKKADAVITAPISKVSLKSAGIKYPGHTEMYADWCGVKNYVMMFLSDNLNAALNSIHVPLKDVPKYISKKVLTDHLKVIINTLRNDLGISYPKVAVLGLNPHAGEDGIIGKEEKKFLSPVISMISETAGPFSPDAFFAAKLYKRYDLVFGMYHDQVLIPFKLLNFEHGVNYTAGLPIIRTSPDHGTAFDIAWKGTADESSILEAFRYADLIVSNRSKR
jgi:4-hydroxythreonine-4-phosphate dehydrogenase